MKKLILIAAAFALSTTVALAQCDNTYVLKSSKTDHLDASGAVKQTMDEKAEVEVNKTKFTVTIDGNLAVTGTIKENVCNWPVPYKEGKSVIKAVVNEEGNDDKNATITIEGKNGKVTIMYELEGVPDNKITVTADSFAEKKG